MESPQSESVSDAYFEADVASNAPLFDQLLAELRSMPAERATLWPGAVESPPELHISNVLASICDGGHE